MSIRQLHGAMDSRELSMWQAYEMNSPGYPEREDYHNAYIISTLINVFKGKGSSVKLKDCLLKFKPPVIEKDVNTLQQKAKTAFQLMGLFKKGK